LRIGIGLLLLAVVGCQTAWIASNASGVVSRMAGSKTPDELLAARDLPAQWRTALEELPTLLEFARESGLRVGNAYQRIDINRDPVSFIVVAAHPENLTLHEWDFPIVGKAPYKGYRYLEHARAEMASLQARGWLAEIHPVSAFSSLGWFPETLPGGVLDLPETQRVRTIFHELVHRTIFISGRADLNESLANHFGNQLTRQWYQKMEAENGDRLALLENEIQDEETLRGHLLRLQQRWSAESFSQDLADFTAALAQESWMSQMGQQNTVRKWSLPTILMWQVYDAGAWPWQELWQECGQDFQVLNWRIRQDFSGTP
jgi:predicted aminopeptidase